MEDAKQQVVIDSEVIRKSVKGLEVSQKQKLWTLNFFLLWQGQLVSTFGSSIYSIILGFWVLSKTGSTAIMGSMMAISILPRVFLSPIAGTYVDRHNKKWIIVITDLINGFSMTLVGIAAILGFAEVWMVVTVGVINGLCGSFFGPAIGAVKPCIINKENLIKGNSALSMSDRGISIIGTSIAGFLYVTIGAPVLFLANGLSYLFSATSELFIKIPPIRRKNIEVNFWTDLKSGVNYVKNFTGLKYLFVSIAILNFFASMSMVLLLPYFNSQSYLGANLYGIAIGFSTAGLLLGYFFLSIMDINKIKKSLFFSVSGIISAICLILIPFIKSYTIIVFLLSINGMTVAFSRSMLEATMQTVVKKSMFGRVYGFKRTISLSLVPIAMVVGGIIAEFIPIGIIISVASTVILIMFIILSFTKKATELIDA